MKHDMNNIAMSRFTSSQIAESEGHVYCVDISGDEVRAVVPAAMAEDFAFGFSTKAEAWSWLVQARETHPDGKRWRIELTQNDECAKHLFDLLSEVCVNEHDEIESEFLHFEQGTERSYIWHWLESTFNVSIAELEGMA